MSPAPVLVEVAAAHRTVCRAIADLARAVSNYVDQVDDRDFRFMGEEIGVELHVSRHKGDRMISRALELTERPAVLQALADGLIDEGKAVLIVDQLSVLSAAHAAIAEADLYVGASSCAGVDPQAGPRRCCSSS